MGTARTAGRIVGFLILVQMACGVLVNFVLEAPLFGAPGFLVSAAAHSTQIGIAALLGVFAGGIFVAIAITIFPLLREHSPVLALGLVALASASFCLSAVENMNVMSMLSLSDAYNKASAVDRQAFEGLRIVVASARNWAHYIGLIVHGGTIFTLYAALYRSALIPRALAVFGLVAVMFQVIAVAMPLFGHGVVFVMLAPLGVSQLLLAAWLIAKGFRGGERSGEWAR
jgi:hypothetical protein